LLEPHFHCAVMFFVFWLRFSLGGLNATLPTVAEPVSPLAAVILAFFLVARLASLL
jgi:hypothetical protein